MELLLGDCLDRLKELEDNSVDAIVTDPPYGLSFMGKKWDYDVPQVEVWKECLRVLKPGGYLLSFAGTRTQHRMAVNIEDAGFEIRDMIAWVYGSGFPKSLNIGKAVDKMGNKIKELQNFSKWFDDICKEKNITNKQLDEYLGLNSGGSTCSHYRGWNTQQPRYPREEHFKKLKEWLEFGDLWDEKIAEVEREVVGKGKSSLGGTVAAGERNPVFIEEHRNKEFTRTKGTSQWEGWGTALKPALEPITVARKPLSEKSVAENCLKWGVGGINIDGCRVGTEERKYKAGLTNNSRLNDDGWDKVGEPNTERVAHGRFPANLIHDGSEEVVGCFPQTKSGIRNPNGNKLYAGNSLLKSKTEDTTIRGFNDSGSAARFFYCSKASKRERNIGCEGLPLKSGGSNAKGYTKDVARGLDRNRPVANFHPTVKPVALMRYLCRLITPKGGVILDPYMGSGTTGIGAKLEGFDFIGIEMMPEYMEIAKCRIDGVEKESQLNML